MIPPLETPRLHLRPLVLDDAPTIQEQFVRLEIVRHLASRVPWPSPAEGQYVSGRLPNELWELTSAAWQAREPGRPADAPEHTHH